MFLLYTVHMYLKLSVCIRRKYANYNLYSSLIQKDLLTKLLVLKVVASIIFRRGERLGSSRNVTQLSEAPAPVIILQDSNGVYFHIYGDISNIYKLLKRRLTLWKLKLQCKVAWTKNLGISVQKKAGLETVIN